MAYSKKEAIALLDLYKEPFDFGTGPMNIEDINQNEDYKRLERLVQNSGDEQSTHGLNSEHKSTLHSPKRNRYKIDKLHKFKLKREYKLGKRTLVGLKPEHEDYEKYLIKYENKKAKKHSKLRNYLKRHSVKQQRVEHKEIEKQFVNNPASLIVEMSF